MGGILPYKWEAYCSINGRCAVGFPFLQGLEARKVQRYKWGTYRRTNLGASQMTTKFLTIKFAKFPNFIVMEFPRKKNSVLGQFSVEFPLPNPPQNANFINIVVSASLKIGDVLPRTFFETFRGVRVSGTLLRIFWRLG